MRSDNLRLHGKPDLIIKNSEVVIPVEFKLRATPVRKGTKLQLCAYGMLASERFGLPSPFGLIVGHKDNKTVVIDFDVSLKEQVSFTRQAIIDMVDASLKPPSSATNHQCGQCEYLNFCNDRE